LNSNNFLCPPFILIFILRRRLFVLSSSYRRSRIPTFRVIIIKFSISSLITDRFKLFTILCWIGAILFRREVREMWNGKHFFVHIIKTMTAAFLQILAKSIKFDNDLSAEQKKFNIHLLKKRVMVYFNLKKYECKYQLFQIY